MTIQDACDYVIHSVRQSGESLSNLKLQKLLYYVQAWHLAFKGQVMFEGGFEAWVHGPVSRAVFSRFAGSKTLYSDIFESDIRPDFSPGNLSAEQRTHIDNVLSVYGKFSGPQLEEMTHQEAPWVQARADFEPWARCANVIDEGLMQTFYAARL